MPGSNGEVWESECGVFWVARRDLTLMVNRSMHTHYQAQLQHFSQHRQGLFTALADWDQARAHCDAVSRQFRAFLNQRA